MPRISQPALFAWGRPLLQSHALPAAVAVALPPLGASLLCAAGTAGWSYWSAFGLREAGLLFIGLCLAAAWLLPRLRLPGRLACLGTAATVGVVLPALSLHTAAMSRAVVDPDLVVLVPALATAGLVLLSVAATLWLVVSQHRHPIVLRAVLLTPSLFPTWLVGLIWLPNERLVLGVAAFTFATGALAGFLTCLLRGWWSWLPLAVALTTIWLAALSLPPASTPATPAATIALSAQLGLALLSSMVPLLSSLLLSHKHQYRPILNWPLRLIRRRAATP